MSQSDNGVDVDGLVKQILDLTPTDPVKVGA